MKPYCIGTIGAGMYGKIFLKWLGCDPRARIGWVCDVHEAAARAAAAEAGAPRWTTDYREMLADPTLDAVVISTPPFLHAPLFEAALAAGKHVLVEKPLAHTREDLHRIQQAAAAAPDRIILESSCRHTRLTRKFRFLHDWIAEGRLGTVYHIHHRHLSRGTFIEWNPRAAWAMNRALAGGGPFIDWGVYDLSFHLGLLDDRPELLALRSFARNDLRDMSRKVALSDVEQHGAAWMEFSGGLTYAYERGAGVHGETPNETRLYGTRGGLSFQYPSWDSPEVEWFSAEDGEPRKETLTVDNAGAPDDSQALAGHFLDCLDGAEPLMPIERAAKHLEILFKLLGSGGSPGS